MESITLATLGKWDSFYVIVGSSAGALTGLQFVVITLGAESNTIKKQTIRAFATPTVVHLCAVLLMSAILSAPWQALFQVGIPLVVCGITGFGYTLLVFRHTRRQTDYAPVFEDWLWHTALPLIAYLTLLAASVALIRNSTQSLFAIGSAAIVLLFVGIHNSWDAVTYIALDRAQRRQQSEEHAPAERAKSKSRRSS